MQEIGTKVQQYNKLRSEHIENKTRDCGDPEMENEIKRTISRDEETNSQDQKCRDIEPSSHSQ